jgi:nucleoside-diphosphate-sugar epimerase
VLVTGHDGYIGCSLVPVLLSAGHDVVGLDAYFFHDGGLGEYPVRIEATHKDVRDVHMSELEGVDAVIHLAAISNDPLGNLNPECTYEINHRASVRLAELAKRAGVSRFLFSSSCSLYGAAGDQLLDETASFNPVTAYGRSKMLAEREIAMLADDSFSPTFLRNATAHGASRSFRSDLVVNNLVAFAFTTGEVRLTSDGTPWRPLVHVEDISRAFLALLVAPRAMVHNEAFNVGSTRENYQVLALAEIVEDVVQGSKIVLAQAASPDPRNYRVSFEKLAETVPEFRPRWTVADGAKEMLGFLRRHAATLEDITGPRTQRIRRIHELMSMGLLGTDLRWTDANRSASASMAPAIGREI